MIFLNRTLCYKNNFLQKNKVKKAVANFILIHSVDSVELANKISECGQEEGKLTHVLLEVNTSGEKTKHGMSEEAWYTSFEKVLHLPNVKIEGLMTMAPLSDNQHEVRACFRRLRRFRDRLLSFAGSEVTLDVLSMGMSHDYPIAIEEGATLVRIGTAIFQSQKK